ncbi:MAG: hypothetical protein JSR58_08270 [Verrucomicrobia bacterium]|nr:hypothetical protein [Verrucomicrobiota bacterium]
MERIISPVDTSSQQPHAASSTAEHSIIIKVFFQIALFFHYIFSKFASTARMPPVQTQPPSTPSQAKTEEIFRSTEPAATPNWRPNASRLYGIVEEEEKKVEKYMQRAKGICSSSKRGGIDKSARKICETLTLCMEPEFYEMSIEDKLKILKQCKLTATEAHKLSDFLADGKGQWKNTDNEVGARLQEIVVA